MSVELIAILGVGAALAGLELMVFHWRRNDVKSLRQELFGETHGLRDVVRGGIHGLRGEIHGLRGDLRGEIRGLRGELAGLRGAMNGVRSEMHEFRVELTQQLARIEVGLSLRGGR
ncbi:hypothetical protein [Candidatus Palauibacter sp.]|uniref:hypothetical protein n=1 Tax=Candidatus Palauibacter sp. TaxID=3101350 RepID=UPI003CC51B5E